MPSAALDPQADSWLAQMLFTWDTNNLCLIFRWWHIQTTPGLIFSLLAVVALTAAYEFLRSLSRRYEAFAAEKAEETPSKPSLPFRTRLRSWSFICNVMNAED